MCMNRPAELRLSNHESVEYLVELGRWLSLMQVGCKQIYCGGRLVIVAFSGSPTTVTRAQAYGTLEMMTDNIHGNDRTENAYYHYYLVRTCHASSIDVRRPLSHNTAMCTKFCWSDYSTSFASCTNKAVLLHHSMG